MQGGLPVSGLLLPFSVRTGLPGTVHIAAAESEGDMRGGLQEPGSQPSRRLVSKCTAAASPAQHAAAVARTAVSVTTRRPGLTPLIFLWSWGQPGHQNSSKAPQGCVCGHLENHCSKGPHHARCTLSVPWTC